MSETIKFAYDNWHNISGTTEPESFYYTTDFDQWSKADKDGREDEKIEFLRIMKTLEWAHLATIAPIICAPISVNFRKSEHVLEAKHLAAQIIHHCQKAASKGDGTHAANNLRRIATMLHDHKNTDVDYTIPERTIGIGYLPISLQKERSEIADAAKEGAESGAAFASEIIREEVIEFANDQTAKLNETSKIVNDRINDAIDKDFIMGRVEEIAMEMIPREIVVKTPSKTRNLGEAILHEKFDDVIELASMRKNSLLVGPTGCGKSHIAETIAESLGLGFSSCSMSAGITESAFYGYFVPGKDGEFIHHLSPFGEAYKNGGVILVDEIDGADENLLLAFGTAISNNYLSIPQRIHEQMIKRHEDFVLIASANTFGHGADAVYVGRNQLDGATVDRFKCGTIAMGYDAKIESKLVHPQVLTWGKVMRDFVSESRVNHPVSSRVLIDFTDMVNSCNWDRDRWEEAYFHGWNDDEKARAKKHLELNLTVN